MDNNQIIDIKTRITNIQNLNIDSIFSEVLKEKDIESIKIDRFSVKEYVTILHRLLKQFVIEIEDNGYFMPFQYDFRNEYGGGNLANDIQSIHNLIVTKNLQNIVSSVGYINRLVYFQIANGFWDKSVRKVHDSNEVKIVQLNEELGISSKLLKDNIEELKVQQESLSAEKKKLQSFVNQKTSELQQITNNLQSSNSNTNQINQLLTQSTSTNEKINSILNQQTQNFETQKKQTETQQTYFIKQKETFTNQEKMLNDQVKRLDEQIIEFDLKLEFVEDKKLFFEERNNYLNELIGREVGASLFETFKQRKNELEKPVGKWLLIVIGMSALTFLAVLTIFTNGFGYWGVIPTEFSPTLLITNSIKTLPFFFLLFYSIAQYNKERNFQEEYAFKSAVALTVKAYADIIQKTDLKDELIINSVNGIYKSPTIYKSRKLKDDNSILETAKGLLTTALDVLKKR